MSKTNYIVTYTTLKAIADAIRSKTSTSAAIKINEFASKINSITTGSTYTTALQALADLGNDSKYYYYDTLAGRGGQETNNVKAILGQTSDRIYYGTSSDPGDGYSLMDSDITNTRVASLITFCHLSNSLSDTGKYYYDGSSGTYSSEDSSSSGSVDYSSGTTSDITNALDETYIDSDTFFYGNYGGSSTTNSATILNALGHTCSGSGPNLNDVDGGLCGVIDHYHSSDLAMYNTFFFRAPAYSDVSSGGYQQNIGGINDVADMLNKNNSGYLNSGIIYYDSSIECGNYTEGEYSPSDDSGDGESTSGGDTTDVYVYDAESNGGIGLTASPSGGSLATTGSYAVGYTQDNERVTAYYKDSTDAHIGYVDQSNYKLYRVSDKDYEDVRALLVSKGYNPY